MSATKVTHTAGPWRPACRRGYAAVFAGDQNNGTAVADCRTVDVDLPTATANARLIAAAPELLAALRECLAIVCVQNGNLHDDINEIIERATAAIRKAERE